jgi:hypothetical protein
VKKPAKLMLLCVLCIGGCCRFGIVYPIGKATAIVEGFYKIVV